MVNEAFIRKRFESLDPSEISEHLARRDDFTPAAFAILLEVAKSKGLDGDAIARNVERRELPTWRKRLSVREVEDWRRRFAAAPGLTEQEIVRRPVEDSTRSLVTGMLVVNLSFLLGAGLSWISIAAAGVLAYVLFITANVAAKRLLESHSEPAIAWASGVLAPDALFCRGAARSAVPGHVPGPARRIALRACL